MDSYDDLYSSNSNGAVQISLVVPGVGAPRVIHTFNPQFTYPIFGEQESIFGYQGLSINLRYHRSDMRPCVQISYKKKFKPIGETSALDIPDVMSPFLPKTAWEKETDFGARISEESNLHWKPPGELCATVEHHGLTYEVWKGNLTDPAVQTMLRRLQIFVLFFIEGGSFIELRDEDWSLGRWTVFLLYQKQESAEESNISPYIFVGYSTVYRYYYFQPISLPSSPQKVAKAVQPKVLRDFQLPLQDVAFSDLPCRSRISQFIILPPYQNSGHGSLFYRILHRHYLGDQQTVELTVEDPNEAFDDMRDINDLIYLRQQSQSFRLLEIDTDIKPSHDGSVPNNIIPQIGIERVRQAVKIAPRQFARVLEMQLLSLLPENIRMRQFIDPDEPVDSAADKSVQANPEKEHEYYLWSLFVKKRLYKHNRDMLMQLDPKERVQHLEKTLKSVQADYVRLLQIVDHRMGIEDRVEEKKHGKRALGDGDTAEEPARRKVKS